MAAYDWAPNFGAPYYSHQAFLASQQPQQPQQQGGFRIPSSQQQPLPQLPQLSIPGLAPMPNLPQFDTSLPGLSRPNLPGMNVPQLSLPTLPGYQRPSYPDQSGEFSQLGSNLLAMLQGGGQQQGGRGGPAQINSAIDASPAYSSAFSQQLDKGLAAQGNRQVGSLPFYAGGPQARGEIQQTYGDAARQAASEGLSRTGRDRAAAAAPFDLRAQQAQSNSGLGWANMLTGVAQDQQSLQNQQRNSLLNLLLGGLI